MRTEAYTLNRGVNRAIEFRGLKAQYIWWLGGGIVGLLALFAGLYIAGVNSFACLAIVGIGALVLFKEIYRLSRKYGQYGLMKKNAAKYIPDRIRITTKKTFQTWKGI